VLFSSPGIVYVSAPVFPWDIVH